MTRVPNCAFFKIADGYGGHPQVFALFDRSQNPNYRKPDASSSTIDHIAFLPGQGIGGLESEGLSRRAVQRSLPPLQRKSSSPFQVIFVNFFAPNDVEMRIPFRAAAHGSRF